MSVYKEIYIIYGIKFGEGFTKDFWKKDFRDEFEWDENKSKDKPFFITDGMCGDYTFFGFIRKLSDGREWEEEVFEIDFSFTGCEVINDFYKLYPDAKITEDEIKFYYLPHYV